MGIRSQIECLEPGGIVHLSWGIQRSPGRSETQRELLRQAKIFERGRDRVVHGVCFNEKLKRPGESPFAGEVVSVGGPLEMRSQGTLVYQKEVFYPAGHGEPLKNSE